MKKWIFIIIKILVATAALYFALRNINWKELKQFAWSSSLLWLVPALLLLNLSQFISAFRLLRFYRVHQPSISYWFNLRLYYKGMFYNLFLPGGIGGDAYKIVSLKNSSNTYKQLTTATLLDRVNGLTIIVLIIAILSNFVSLHGLYDDLFSWLPILTAVGLPCYWLLVYFLFKPFHKVLPLTGLLSIFVQACQLLCFYCILYALQADSGAMAEYAFLFFVSTIISALPFSIGGIGTRELAMATGAAHFHLSAIKIVSASLLLFLLIALSSVVGWAVSSRSVKKKQDTFPEDVK
jgi:uncharacterized membrane protein YbhN (UPF0104 family)